MSGVAERVQLAHRRGGCRPTAAAVVFSRTAAMNAAMNANEGAGPGSGVDGFIN